MLKLPRLSQPGGLPKIVLGIVGVWGLLAGAMLIHTLLATKQLHRRVATITATVSDIDQDTTAVALMLETNRISSDLLAATRPVPGTLDDLSRVTGGISRKVDAILAGSSAIEGNTQAIEVRVLAARDTAAAIDLSVKSIAQSLKSILATLRTTQQAAGEINVATRGTGTALDSLLLETQAIDTGIGASNRGIAEAAAIVDALRADVAAILALLPDMVGHANSIDCSSAISLFNPAGTSGEACGP